MTQIDRRVTGCRFVQFADSYTWIFQAWLYFIHYISYKETTYMSNYRGRNNYSVSAGTNFLGVTDDLYEI